MADNERGGGSGWLGFLAGIIVVALIGVAIYAMPALGARSNRRNSNSTSPSVKINPPDVQLPSSAGTAAAGHPKSPGHSSRLSKAKHRPSEDDRRFLMRA
jgi:hypothetical protein